MSKLNIHACPLCGGNHLKYTMTCVDHYASGEHFDLLRCEDCGFQFTQDFPLETEIGRYYETPDYISHSDTKKGVINSLYHLVRKRMLNRKARLILHLLGKKDGNQAVEGWHHHRGRFCFHQLIHSDYQGVFYAVHF